MSASPPSLLIFPLLAASAAGASILPLEPPHPVSDADGGFQRCPVLAAGDGGYVLGWQSTASTQYEAALRLRLFDERGRPAAPVTKLGSTGELSNPLEDCSALSVVPREDGAALAFWVVRSMPNPFSTFRNRIYAAPVAADGTPGPAVA